MDAEFESVSASLKVPFWTTLRRVTLPICTPALVDIARYFFVNAMTTVSALIFLFTAHTRVAAIAVVNLVEGSRIGQAAAFATVIMLVSIAAALIQTALRAFVHRTQPWRGPTP
jgi:iron(III) transport system permease protein